MRTLNQNEDVENLTVVFHLISSSSGSKGKMSKKDKWNTGSYKQGFHQTEMILKKKQLNLKIQPEIL